jgi:hypothetical protein
MSETLVDALAPAWPSEPRPVEGIVYVATGARYLDEARAAAAFLRRTHPKIPICLVTDRPIGPVFWDDLVLLANPAFGFRDKIFMGLCPYERFLFLDTDTWVMDDIADVLGLLRDFDFVGHQLFEGHDCPLPGIPDAFPEFNSGVLGFRRTPALAEFFSRWLACYDAYHALNAGAHYHYSNVSDQKSLRQTVFASEMRIAVLGPEYNFVPHHVNFACDRVRILHGRSLHHVAELGSRLNAKLGNRAYIPRLDVVVHDDMLPGELGRMLGMGALQLIRKAGRRLTPLRLRNRLRRSALVRFLFLRNRFAEGDETHESKWREPNPPTR